MTPNDLKFTHEKTARIIVSQAIGSSEATPRF